MTKWESPMYFSNPHHSRARGEAKWHSAPGKEITAAFSLARPCGAGKRDGGATVTAATAIAAAAAAFSHPPPPLSGTISSIHPLAVGWEGERKGVLFWSWPFLPASLSDG